MTRRYFWQVPEFIKFRTVFEDSETILGATEDNEHQLFRKDTGAVCFDEAEALHISESPDRLSLAKTMIGNSKAKLKKALSIKSRIRDAKPKLSLQSPQKCYLH